MLMSNVVLSLGSIILTECALPVTASWPTQSFKSVNLLPPVLEITKNGPTAPGYLFFSPKGIGALIMADDRTGGDLIWQGPSETVFALDKGELDSESILVYWTGSAYPDPNGFGYGMIKVFNSAYENIYNVTLPQSEGSFYTGTTTTYNSYIDLHESFVTDRGSVMVTATNVTQADLTSVGGPSNGWLRQSLFYEIDIKTNEIIYQWNSWDHRDQIPLTGTLETLHDEGSASSSPFNYFHINAASPFQGYYIISSRYYCAVFLIDPKDGSVVWELQGQNGGDFTLPADAQFCYQHDVRIVNMTSDNVVLHVHDNANSYWVNGTTPTSGLLLSIDLTTKEVTKLARYQNPADPLFAISQGSYEALPNGNVFMGHGYLPIMEEFDENGTCVETVQFGVAGTTSSYRGFRYEWAGQPKTAPAVAGCIDDTSNSVNLYVSWNGATQVEEWEVYATYYHSNGQQQVECSPKTGFETTISVEYNAHIAELMVQAQGFQQSASLSLASLGVC